MLKFTSTTDTRLARLPPAYRSAVQNTVATLCSIFPPEPDPDMQGFVAFIEPQDEPEVLHQRIGQELENSIECTFRDGSCLVGVVLFGNSGEGLTIVCPDEEGYAPGIVRILKLHLIDGAPNAP